MVVRHGQVAGRSFMAAMGFMLAAGLLLAPAGHSATTYKKALDKKTEAYINEGVVIGGRAGRSFSLLNVRRDLAKNASLERVILDLGDAEGRPLKGAISYFQVAVEQNPPRVVVDLSQLTRSAVAESKLRRQFAQSPFVKRVDLTADPEDNSSSLVLHLKQPMKVEVFEMPATDKASRIVMDFKKVDSASLKR